MIRRKGGNRRIGENFWTEISDSENRGQMRWIFAKIKGHHRLEQPLSRTSPLHQTRTGSQTFTGSSAKTR